MKCHSVLYPNDREGMSEILLWRPGMWIGVIGHALVSFSLYASTRRSSAAGSDFLAAIRSIHATDGLLSLSSTTCLCFRSCTTCSIISQTKISPAISRSEFVIFPSGLCSVCNCSFISLGHSNLNTVGTQLWLKPKITPPTPSPDASTMPAMSGSPFTNWQTCVGLCSTSLKMILQSVSA